LTKSGQAVKAQLETIRAAIRERHRTPHAFCRAHPELKRATVYMVLSGKYPGNLERQAAKIEAALAGKVEPASPALITAQEAHTVLQGAKCAHCRRLDKRGCPECQRQTAREAQALEEYLRSREGL
jgi:hypothetical protein